MDYVLGSLIGLLVIFGIYYIITYNQLQRLKNSMSEAASGIDIALHKRFDLITNLVEVVKGYSKHEKELLTDLVNARSQLGVNNDVAEDGLNSVVSNLNVVVENYPELKASDQYLNLQKNLSNVEEHLQASRRLYNRSTTKLNDLVSTFPSNIVAKRHGFDVVELFSTADTNKLKPNIKL